MPDDIVITGIGIVSPLGIGKKEFWENSLNGKSAIIQSKEMMSARMKSSTYSKIKELNYENHLQSIEEQTLKNQSKFAKNAYIAAKEAILDAQIKNYLDKEKVGIISSSAIGGTPEIQEIYEEITQGGVGDIEYKNVGDKFYNNGMFNYPATEISKIFGFNGICVSLSTGCTAGLDALITGIQLLESNELDIAIVGASEAPLCTLTYSTLNAIGALSKWEGEPSESSRPFDKKRCGFVISESSVYLVLEKKKLAEKRGSSIYGYLKGVASLCNANHMTDLKDSEALSETIRQAIQRSGLNLNSIDYINAHGSSTKQNDKCESEAFHKVFGSLIDEIPVTSTKSMMGHPLSSASLVALVSTIGAIQNSIVPPNINYEYPDHECELNITLKPTNKIINTALVTASGFGGIHSACIIGK